MKQIPRIPLMAALAAVFFLACALATPVSAESEAAPPPGPPPQGPTPPGPPPGHHHPPHDPLRRALDADGDHVISSDEIANAASALKALDKNGDGRLDREELRPPMPPGMHRRPGPEERERGDRSPGERRGPPGVDGAQRRGPRPEMLVERMMEFDADSDGKLDRSELMNAAEKMATTMAEHRREFMEKMHRRMSERDRTPPPAP